MKKGNYGDPGPKYELEEQTKKQAEEDFEKSINVEEIDINKYKGRRGER